MRRGKSAEADLFFLGQRQALDGFFLPFPQHDRVYLAVGLDVVNRADELLHIIGNRLAVELEENVVILDSPLGGRAVGDHLIDDQSLSLREIELIRQGFVGWGNANA